MSYINTIIVIDEVKLFYLPENSKGDNNQNNINDQNLPLRANV
jgi:hypothetical protein